MGATQLYLTLVGGVIQVYLTNPTFVLPLSPLRVPTQNGGSTRGKRNFLNKSKKKMFDQEPQQVLHRGSARKVGGADDDTATKGAGGATTLHKREEYKKGEEDSAYFADRKHRAVGTPLKSATPTMQQTMNGLSSSASGASSMRRLSASRRKSGSSPSIHTTDLL